MGSGPSLQQKTDGVDGKCNRMAILKWNRSSAEVVLACLASPKRAEESTARRCLAPTVSIMNLMGTMTTENCTNTQQSQEWEIYGDTRCSSEVARVDPS